MGDEWTRYNACTSGFGPTRGIAVWVKTALPRRLAWVSIPQCPTPVCVRPSTTDFTVLREVFVRRVYDIMLSFDPELVLDAGANAGYTSLFFANRYSRATVLAIEPESSNVKMLRLNTRGYRNVVVLHAALWKTDRPLRIEDPSAEKWAFRVCDAHTGDGETVRGLCVDSVLRATEKASIDLFKMDIEGAEREVFSSPSEWLDQTKALIVELHDSRVPGCEAAFRRAIGRRSFTTIDLSENVVLAINQRHVPH